MKKHHIANERIKRHYLIFLSDAKGQSESTIDAIAKSLNRFEEHTKFRDFKSFHYEQARAFKRKIAEQKAQRSGEKLSKSTLHATLNHLKSFFQWLSMQPNYKSKISYTDTDYFNLSEKDTRIAKARRQKPVPTVEQIKHVINVMPNLSEIERRDRALVAFTLLTGARDGAIASMKLKHVNLDDGYVEQDAREVKTKFSKTFRTYFFPVGDEIREILTDWVKFLRDEKFWGNHDPLFPSTMVGQGPDMQFCSRGLERRNWQTTSPIRKIFREAFELAELEYFKPHSFRDTLALLGEKICPNIEDFKAWSQNLGHENMLTTLTSYGEIPTHRQGEIFRDLASSANEKPTTNTNELLHVLLKELRIEAQKLPEELNLLDPQN